MSVIYEYEITCNVHGLVNSTTYPELSGGGIFGITAPTHCPLDNTDTVLGHRVIAVNEQHEVKVQEEDIPTQGYMEVLGYTFDIPAGNTGDITRCYISMEDTINVYEVNILCEEDNRLDTYDIMVGPPVPIGAITQNINVGDQYVYLTSYAMTLFKRGFSVAVKQGADLPYSVGRIIEVDLANSRVKLRFPSTLAMTAGSPVYLWATRAINVPMTIYPLTLGNGKIGGSNVPKDFVVTLFYKNNTGLAKKFKVIVEDTY